LATNGVMQGGFRSCWLFCLRWWFACRLANTDVSFFDCYRICSVI